MFRTTPNRIGFKIFAICGITFFALSYAQAVDLYFGEDMGLGELQRLQNHPNADVASSQFRSHLFGTHAETFDELAYGTPAPLNVHFYSAGTTTVGGGGFVNTVTFGTNGYGRYPISGNNYWETGSSQFYLDFNKPVSAIGFYAVDVGDFQGQLDLTITMVDGTLQDVIIPSVLGAPGGSVLYFGLISPDLAFTHIAMSDTAQGVDFFGVDNLTVASEPQLHSAVPGPVAGLVFATGMLLRRRRM